MFAPRIGVAGWAALAALTAACSGEELEHETAQDLLVAVEAAPDFACSVAYPMHDHVQADFRSRFPGLLDVGHCIADKRSFFVIVFEGRAEREEFVDSEKWVDFARVFTRLEDGQVLTGVAGDNWLIAEGIGINDPPGPYEYPTAFVEELGGDLVESEPAEGTSGPTGS